MVVVVGRPRAPGVRAAIDEYESRAARYWPFEVHEVREESARATPPDLVREREGERLAVRLPAAGTVVACDLEGTPMRSEEFAAWLQREREVARDVAFVIGGAHGLAPAVRAIAARSLALAPWTLPHELARLVLAEQLYRAGTIVRGEPYHK
ncbi:MAG TPA: 23S rRNA (pseudouridine(1915)-N(3))-methyltransferase RlmH [Gemmatimonadaceae bacterium]|nr:23S rRNA (pseudouridine(1915)-N(3))-methyltransferase RlmH [Gemmatimonadaceae bacterium]